MFREVEADGFITRDDDLKGSVNMNKAEMDLLARWAWLESLQNGIEKLDKHIDETGHLDPEVGLAIKRIARRMK